MNKILTLQTNKRRRSGKASQIMAFEYSLHFSIQVCFWVTTVIFQLHLDIALELIEFREYRYHRDLGNPPFQFRFIKLHPNIPFLSGQIPPKYLSSSDGRSLSIGIQYLKNNPVKSQL